MQQTILLIEDDPNILKINRAVLTKRGYRILEAETIREAEALMEREKPDLLVLDILLPDGNGRDFCRRIRENSRIPILFLTALDESADEVEGFLSGGDDYLSKPYDLEVLCVRIAALLQRAGRGEAREPEEILKIGRLELHMTSHRVYRDGTDLLLKPLEFGMLEYLVRHQDGWHTPEEVYRNVWGMAEMKDVRTLWTNMSRMRRKVEENSGVKIVNERGKGYRIEIEG